MDVRALLFGSKIRIAVTVIAGLVLALGGAFLAGFIGVPSVERVDNQFGAVNETDTEIRTELGVHNPNPIRLRLGSTSVNYSVSMNDVQVATGERKGIGAAPGNSALNLTTYLQNGKIPDWWVTHIRNDEQTDLTIDATVKPGLLGQSASFQPASRSIETDLISQFNSTEERPVNMNHPLVEDPVLIIEETSATWGEVTSSETPIPLEFDVYNPKTAPVVISSIGYNITMNDVQVGSGETEETVTIPGETSRVVETPTAIQNERLDEWWVSHVENNQVTELRIAFSAEVQPQGSDETVSVPLDDLTYTRTIETDFFGTKDEGSAGADENTDDSSTDDGSTDDGSTNDDSTNGSGTTASDGTSEGSTTTSGDDTSSEGDETTTDGGVLARWQVAHR